MIQTFFRAVSGRFEAWAGTLFGTMIVHPNSEFDQPMAASNSALDEDNDRLEHDESFYWGSGIFGHW